MLCKNPFITAGGLAHGCGQCLPCRYNKRRVWQHRIMLEAYQYVENSFVTLTCRPDCDHGCDTLVPGELRNWLKRLRERVEPSRFRYFAVGEYGDETERPHYHAALFGFPSCRYGQSRYSQRIIDCCYWCDLVRDTWGHGNVYLGTLEAFSAGYLAGYVTKKMTRADDPRLNGRYPEFARMSLKPGIGYDAMYEVASVLLQHEVRADDVPLALRHGPKQLPLGRYLRRKLRTMVGADEKISQAALDKISEEMRPLQMVAREDDKNPSLKAHLIAQNAGRVASMEGKVKLYKKERRL